MQRGDGARLFLVGLVRDHGSEIAVEALQLGRELSLGRRVLGRDALGALVPQVAKQELQQLVGLARRHEHSVADRPGLRRSHPSRLEVQEHPRQLVTDAGARRQIEHVALEHGFFDRRAGAQHHAGDEPPDRVRCEPRRAPLCRAIPDGHVRAGGGGSTLGVRRHGRRDQAERQAPRPGADRFDQL